MATVRQRLEPIGQVVLVILFFVAVVVFFPLALIIGGKVTNFWIRLLGL